MPTIAIANDLTDEIAAGHSITDLLAIAAEHSTHVSIDRNTAIKAIRAALKRRSGKTWSVTGGRGTGWGWISIDAPPKRRTGAHVKNGDKYELVDTGQPQEFGLMTPQDCAELGELLGMNKPVHCQIASSTSAPEPEPYAVTYWS